MNVRTNTMLILAAAICVQGAPDAALAGEKKKEEHFDVWIRIVEDRLVTGRITEDEIPMEPEWRVFGAEFGEDPQFPYSSDEPGFQIENGDVSPFEPFHFVVPDKLTRWENEQLLTTTETVSIQFGPANTTTGNGFTDGFALTADNLGGFHTHFELTLNPGAGPVPADGIYVLPLLWAGRGGSLVGTPTFYFVMNLNRPEAEHEAAMEWVQSNLVDPPTTCSSDADENGTVDFADILRVISNWGPCP